MKERQKVKSNLGFNNKPMTLIIGIRCKDGVVLAGDRKVLRGAESSEEKKLRQVIPNFIVGASGVSGLMDKFLDHINAYLAAPTGAVNKNKTWTDFILFMEDSAEQLLQRYGRRLDVEDNAEMGAYAFEVLYCAKMTKDYANLFHMYNTGFSTEIKKFDIIGHGQPHALPFLKALYYDGISMDEAVKLCAFILQLIDVCNVDITVGGKPQIFKIPDNGDAKELSDNEIDTLIISLPVKDRLKTVIFS